MSVCTVATTWFVVLSIFVRVPARLLATQTAPGAIAMPVVPAGRFGMVATRPLVAGSTRTTVFVRQSVTHTAVSEAAMYHASIPIGIVATTLSLTGSMRTSDFVSPWPAHTAAADTATALGRSQLRM